MERAFSCADILVLILNYTGKKDQTRCARVCKAWFDIAVRVIWRTLDDANALLRLFPILRYKDGTSSYQTHTEKHWIRFNYYAKFVKELTSNRCGNDTFKKIYDEIAYTRSTARLLPNLTVLKAHCISDGLQSVFFLHEGLQHLSIHGVKNLSEFHKILKYILPRTPNITSLHIESNDFIRLGQLENHFISALQTLNSLEDLKITNMALTRQMYANLVCLPELKVLHYSSNHLEIEDQEKSPQICMNEDSFSSLESLTIKTTTAVVSRFLFWGARFQNIKSLDVVITNHATEKFMQHLCKTLASSYYTLKRLSIKFTPERSGYSNIINFESLQYLLIISDLQFVVIHHPKPLPITDAEVEHMAVHWPNILHLDLNSRPQTSENSQLSLAAIGSFARHCKNIKFLALFVDATNTDELPTEADLLFENLTTLSFGFSSISDPDAVALYLSQFCTPLCQLSQDPTLLHLDGDYRRHETLMGMLRMWIAVSKSLSLILRALDRVRRVRRIDVS